MTHTCRVVDAHTFHGLGFEIPTSALDSVMSGGSSGQWRLSRVVGGHRKCRARPSLTWEVGFTHRNHLARPFTGRRAPSWKVSRKCVAYTGSRAPDWPEGVDAKHIGVSCSAADRCALTGPYRGQDHGLTSRVTTMTSQSVLVSWRCALAPRGLKVTPRKLTDYYYYYFRVGRAQPSPLRGGVRTLTHPSQEAQASNGRVQVPWRQLKHKDSNTIQTEEEQERFYRKNNSKKRGETAELPSLLGALSAGEWPWCWPLDLRPAHPIPHSLKPRPLWSRGRGLFLGGEMVWRLPLEWDSSLFRVTKIFYIHRI